VPRPRAMVASGKNGAEVLALVAAGVHDGTQPSTPALTRLRQTRSRLCSIRSRRSAEVRSVRSASSFWGGAERTLRYARP
jgi:hypothetical protein